MSLVPVIALVGRPNVGKSTLFNRLTRTRDALVANLSGLTRDRQYGHAHFAEHNFIVIDTGGISGGEEGVDGKMARQSLQAAEEADVVLFLGDARTGVTTADHLIVDQLRVLQKPSLLVVNKIDGVDPDSAISEFFDLGFGVPIPIAASQNRGIQRLLTTTFEALLAHRAKLDLTSASEPDGDDVQAAETSTTTITGPGDDDAPKARVDWRDTSVKLAIIGRPNVGKSTLVNRMLGEERVVVFDLPGTTRDSIYIDMERRGKHYTLIDTAGVRKRGRIKEVVEKFSVVKTLQAVEDAHVVVMVVDAREGIAEQDLSLLGFVLDSGRSLVIAINKWDGMTSEQRAEVKEALSMRLQFVEFAKLHFISALHGSGVGDLFDSVQDAWRSANVTMTTRKLTDWLVEAQYRHQPPMVHGRRIKLRMAHAGGHNPPWIIIHGNQTRLIPPVYQRYLSNFFRTKLHLVGTPVRFEFKSSENPFAGRHNALNAHQKAKRQRMIQHIKRKEKKIKAKKNR